MEKDKTRGIYMKKKLTISLAISLMILSLSPLISSGDIYEYEKEEFLNTENPDDDFSITVIQQDSSIRLSLHINDFTQIYNKIDDRVFVSIAIGKESQILKKGFPDLPNICRSVIIPNDAHMKINIIDADYQEIKDINIAPSKGDIVRPNTPDSTPFTFSDIYTKNTWYPENIIELRDPYILRDFRGQTIEFQPFQYNPAQKTLRVYTSLTVEMVPDGPGLVNVLNKPFSSQFYSKSYRQIYVNNFLNFGDTRYSMVPEEGNMLVICNDGFYNEMIPFIIWKNMKGIPTEMVNLSEIGSTATDIDTYIDNYYHSNGLTFVLLVGDIDEIPSLYYSGHASDPSYSYIVGDDNYQDIFIGRFSAQNSDQVITQVERSIEYEKYPQTGANWYHKGTGIGSPEGTGDDNEYDWEHMRNLRNLLMNFTYSFVDEFYGGSHGGDDANGEPETSAVMSSLNEGRSILNHCGHGAWDGIGWSAMPGWYVLHSNDINDLTNDNKLPYVVLVACNSGEFEHYDSCFAETWMRATNDSEPSGGIGVFASTQSQSWDPPMEAQDEIVDLLINLSYNTMGGLSYSGTMSMMDSYGPSCYDETNTWTLFGDPSLQIRADTPTSMTVDHDPSIMSGETEFEVTVSGIEGVICAISHDGNLLGYSYTDIAGVALITFADPIEDMDELDLVVTYFNKMPYMAVLDVSPPLRNIAEFEPMQGVLIRYPFGISYDLISEMSEDAIVTTIVADASEQAYVDSQYDANGVNTSNRDYLIAPSDSHWTRDYGPWFRYNFSVNEIEVIDFDYNRPRPNDDNIPNVFASYYGLNSIYMDIKHTGGNYMTEGHGISVSTQLVLTENPTKTEEQIKEMFRDYLGIQTYHLYPDPLGEYIEHVDCWGKYLSPDTIMIIEVDPSHSNYLEIEAAADYFENQTSSYGTLYTVVRVYCHLQEPYINSLILNDKVLVPITGSQYDAGAISAYETAMPGYEVLGFTGSWQNTDALHCRTKGIPDFDMIQIDHEILIDQMPNDAGFEVNSDMLSYDNSKAIICPEVHWKNNTGVWNVESMTVDENTYTAYIPNHPCGEIIYYYISAENSNGDVFNDPFIGTADPHSFMVTLVPDIWVDPSSFDVSNSADGNINEILTIGNDEFAGEQLNVTISVTDQEGFGWLTINETSGFLAPDDSMPVLVSINASGLSIGEYTESIIITSNDPDEQIIIIPVHLTVVLAHDVGALSVNAPTGTLPHGQYTINATVTNYGSINQTDVLVNCTIFKGGVPGPILIEDFKSYPEDWIITDVEGVAWTWDNSDLRMEHTYSSTNINAGFLDSPIIDCSGKIGINLSFWHYWKADYTSGDQDGYVRGSIDGGDTYPILIDEFHHNNPGEETAVKTYNLSWADNQANVRIRFDVYNDNDWYWYIDDFNISSSLSGNITFTTETTMDIPAYRSRFVEFPTNWSVSENGLYTIQVETLLGTDQNNVNDNVFGLVEVFEDVSPPLVSDVSSYPNPQIVDGFVNISCHVSDETTIGDVFVDIVGPAGFVPVNVSMNTCGSDGYYYLENYSVEGNYSFEIYTFDTSGNSIVYSGYGFEIVNQSSHRWRSRL
jgi:agmatine/peptidylarginine deiminase